MKKILNGIFWESKYSSESETNIAAFILRFFLGLALCIIFEKFLPRDGIWGPQAWFIQDVEKMGFPFPIFFAWMAVLIEFLGGILLTLGLFTKPAALLNAAVTFTAAFVYHSRDIGQSGLLAFFFMIMCITVFILGSGKFSIDYLINRNLRNLLGKKAALIIIFFAINCSPVYAQSVNEEKTSIQEVLTENDLITFSIKNGSILPKSRTFIIYRPDQIGNNTTSFFFWPLESISLSIPEGSKIFDADDQQISTVMSGRSIADQTPFIFVKKDLKDKTIELK